MRWVSALCSCLDLTWDVSQAGSASETAPRVSAPATRAPSQNHVKIINQRRPEVAALSALAILGGLAAWFFASMIGANTGALVGVFVASIGLTFFFPALHTYLLARR